MLFSLEVEVIAALIIAVLMIYSYKQGRIGEWRHKCFWYCLDLSMASIVMDIFSVWGIRCISDIPIWLNILVSSLYYLLICLNAGVVCGYLVYLIFEHSSRQKDARKAYYTLVVLFGATVLLVISNLFTDCLFSFREGNYYRGPLNYAGYVIVLLEVMLVGGCYFVNRKYAGPSMRIAMRTMPYAVFLLILYQSFDRDVMMNGMVAALADMILFICFQSRLISADYLTNLGNRGAFVQELTERCKEKKQFHAILISLNRFGQVNRKFGQKTGDEFLYKIARYLDNFSRNCKAFRVGSLEFGILCSDESCGNIGHCIREIQGRFEKPWEAGEVRYRLSASYADLLWTGEEWDGTQIIERLEYAMYLAKEKGENQRVHFDKTINEMLERQKFLVDEMKAAIAEKSYQVYYQPIYCWEEDLFCSAEALVRMTDRSGNMIYPGEFIPIAEESGMIVEISWIILEKVCAFLAAHPELELKAVTVNMSVQQLLEEDMEDILTGILSKYDVGFERIKIEITERVISENAEKVRKVMDSLVEKGIRFCLDDFGTGYSNFASVLSFPIDTIKLDKSLTDRVLHSGKEREIVDAIAGMFVGTGYSIVAEGAETQETVEELKKLQVDRIQGYYYSRPLPEQEFIRFMEEKKAARGAECCK